MDSATYAAWWPLHLRVARGESLAPDEKVAYEAGLRQLHAAETLDDLKALQEARAAVARAEAERERLAAERDALDAEIAALERALSEPMRQALGVAP